LAVAASAVFVSVLTATMINVLVPLIGARFGASAAEVGWVLTGYSPAYAVGVPLYGRISDLFGVRDVFSVGLAGFAVGGMVCALAPSLAVLAFGRIVQGIGGAAVPALAIVSVAKVLPAGERGAGIGLIGSSLGTAAAVGPVLGGVLGQLLGWRALFVGTLALALVLIPFARRVLPDGGSEGGGRDERAFDLLGASSSASRRASSSSASRGARARASPPSPRGAASWVLRFRRRYSCGASSGSRDPSSRLRSSRTEATWRRSSSGSWRCSPTSRRSF